MRVNGEQFGLLVVNGADDKRRVVDDHTVVTEYEVAALVGVVCDAFEFELVLLERVGQRAFDIGVNILLLFRKNAATASSGDDEAGILQADQVGVLVDTPAFGGLALDGIPSFVKVEVAAHDKFTDFHFCFIGWELVANDKAASVLLAPAFDSKTYRRTSRL